MGGGATHFWPCSQPLIYPAFLGWFPTVGCIESQCGGYDLVSFFVPFWSTDTTQSKSETVCPFGINDLSPLVRQRYVSTLTRLNVSLVLPFLKLLPPYCLVSQSLSRGWKIGWVGGKRTPKEKELERQGWGGGSLLQSEVKPGQEIQQRKDWLAASAAVTGMPWLPCPQIAHKIWALFKYSSKGKNHVMHLVGLWGLPKLSWCQVSIGQLDFDSSSSREHTRAMQMLALTTVILFFFSTICSCTI